MPIPVIELNNGVEIPALGFGVFQAAPDATVAAVEAALATGYRHIDTAAAYGNEREVGEVIRRSGIDRSKVFVETKIWISDATAPRAGAIGDRFCVHPCAAGMERERSGGVVRSRSGLSDPRPDSPQRHLTLPDDQ